MLRGTVRSLARCCTASWPHRSTGPGRDPSLKPTFPITSSKNPSHYISHFLTGLIGRRVIYQMIYCRLFLFLFIYSFFLCVVVVDPISLSRLCALGLVTKRRRLIGTILSWKSWWIHCPSSTTSASQLTGWPSSCVASKSSYAVRCDRHRSRSHSLLY